MAAGQSELKNREDASAALNLRLEQTLIELERFRAVLDAEAEAARILGETRLERNRTELEQLGVETHWTLIAKALEFKETLRIEQQIIENPVIAAQWTRHQIEVEESIEQSEEEALATV